MITDTSILKRLPAQLDRKQILIFDGIRHAAEIVSFAYSRLQHTLTKIAVTDDHTTAASEFTSAFLDAWSLVDAIDRFRSLWLLVPSADSNPHPNNEPSFQQISQPVRDLRNVADHLAQRSDYIVACRGTALGVLSWYTAIRQDGREGFICTISPGTQLTGSHQIVNPAGRTGEYPTSLIELAAGEHRACLSEVLPHMETRVRQLETSLEHDLARLGLSGEQAGTDLLIRMQIVANDANQGNSDTHGDADPA